MTVLIYLVCSCFLCGYFPDPLRFKLFPLVETRDGKITTQEAGTHQVNKLKRISLKITAKIYLLESIT